MVYYLFRLLQQYLVVIGHPRLGYIAHRRAFRALHIPSLGAHPPQGEARFFNHAVRGTRAARLQSGVGCMGTMQGPSCAEGGDVTLQMKRGDTECERGVLHHSKS